MSTPVSVTMEHAASYTEWRTAARSLMAQNVSPEQVAFVTLAGSADLFGSAPEARVVPGVHNTSDARSVSSGASSKQIRVPAKFPQLAKNVLCHADDARFSILYQLLHRFGSEPQLLNRESDPLVWRARRMAKSVLRDMHKMKAFVRFKKVTDEQGEAFVAWFEPEHHIIKRTAPFFAKRFTGMRWSIVTPGSSAHWDGDRLTFSGGATISDVPNEDALEHHWRVYYSSIFNPARLKISAMRAEMPIKYWKNLPESRLIPELTRSGEKAQRAAPAGRAPSVVKARQSLLQFDSLATGRNDPQTLDALAQQLQACRRCNLCQHATMAVPGEGLSSASLMIVGEQPGDYEDLAGRPFIGPAGEVLDAALEEAGIDRGQVYLTNAVKHFKYKVRGKRRIHDRPDAGEIEHCRWWLDQERALVKPTIILAMGATAARAVLGREVKVSDVRGRVLGNEAGDTVIVAIHPAYLLRLTEKRFAREQRKLFVQDLKLAQTMSL